MRPAQWGPQVQWVQWAPWALWAQLAPSVRGSTHALPHINRGAAQVVTVPARPCSAGRGASGWLANASRTKNTRSVDPTAGSATSPFRSRATLDAQPVALRESADAASERLAERLSLRAILLLHEDDNRGATGSLSPLNRASNLHGNIVPRRYNYAVLAFR